MILLSRVLDEHISELISDWLFHHRIILKPSHTLSACFYGCVPLPCDWGLVIGLVMIECGSREVIGGEQVPGSHAYPSSRPPWPFPKVA